MDISNIIMLLGGVSLFLFGMSLMGKGLNRVAGNKLEIILYRLSNTALKGMLLGTGVTAVIQSSSATSVMVVGFVNSGIMKVRQAISVILGALIGTSITGWIICLSSIEGSGAWVSLLSTSTISAFVAIVGIILCMFSRKQTKRYVGEILLGFAVLMFGMHSMSDAVEPLRESATFIRVMTTFSNPLLGILVGTAFAAILQSSSAAVGILQALSTTGVISFAVAYPMILGIGVGASVPVLLSALNSKTDGRRCALSYLVIEVIGVILCGTVFYAVDAAKDLALNDIIMNSVRVAAANTIFHAVTSIVLLPFVGGLEKLVSSVIKGTEEEPGTDTEFEKLDDRFLKHPALAVEQSGIAVNSMALCSKENAALALQLLNEFSDSGFAAMEQSEETVDSYEEKLGAYLMKINSLELSPDENRQLSKYQHALSDLELISDHAMNIAKTAREIHEKKIRFSEAENRELSVLSEALLEMLELTSASFTEDDPEKAFTVEPLEGCIDMLCSELKRRHLSRLQSGESSSSGLAFHDVLSEAERVADHCSNLAITLIELHSKAFGTNNNSISQKTIRNQNFDELYSNYMKKYALDKNEE